jgi:TatD DNase family protein
MIIDSHCHLEYEPMISNLSQVIERASRCNVKYLLSISTTNKSFLRILEIVKKYKNVYGTYGIHPHETKNYKDINEEEIIKKISLSKKIIGIGETGLDFYYENSDPIIQKKAFIKHIKAAQILNLPLIVHTRSAEDETYNILKTEKKKKRF